MKRKRHTPEQIIRKLRDADARPAGGATIAEVARELGVSETTFHRWRARYGGMKADEAKRLRELERENARLKKIVAEQALDLDMLREVARETPEPGPETGCRGSFAAALWGLLVAGRVGWSGSRGRASATCATSRSETGRSLRA